MGNTDSLPVVSQVKSGVQLVCGDVEGAARTQEKFLHECPGVSQVTSGVYLLAGEGQKALDTQKRCGKGLLNAADGIPVVGHAKGVIHYVVGDKEGGHKAMKSATRTTGVLAGGAGGFLLGGPMGAVAGGVYGGALTDTTTTLVTGEDSGYVAAIGNAVKNPNPGDIFDLCMMPVADGLAGHSVGSVVRRITTPKTAPAAAAPGTSGQSSMATQADLVKAGELRAQAQATFQAAEANQMHVPEIQTLTEMSKAQKMWNAANKLEGKVELATPKAAASAQAASSSAQVHTVVIPVEKAAEKLKEAAREKARARSKSKSKTEKEDSEDDEEECTCTNISIPVLYVNIRSVNPNNKSAAFLAKIAAFRALIAGTNPAIIAIVETWLGDGHQTGSVADSLGLQGYTIWRQDRSGKRGGGILLAWRSTMLSNGNLLRLERDQSERFNDNILAANIFVDINCMKCNKADGFHEDQQNKFGFTVVYRPPSTKRKVDARERHHHMVTATGNEVIHTKFTRKIYGEALSPPYTKLPYTLQPIIQKTPWLILMNQPWRFQYYRLKRAWQFGVGWRQPLPVNFARGFCMDNLIPRRRYHDDGETDKEFRKRVTNLMEAYEDYLINYDGWSVVGDFNFREGENDPNFQDLLTYAWDGGAQVFPNQRLSTHRSGGCLDLVIASQGQVDGFRVSPESISDHHALTYNLKLGKDYRSDKVCKQCMETRMSKLRFMFT